MSALFDVIGTNIKTGAERVMDRGLTAENAEAYIRFAVLRRGVGEEFFTAVPASTVKASTP